MGGYTQAIGRDIVKWKSLRYTNEEIGDLIIRHYGFDFAPSRWTIVEWQNRYEQESRNGETNSDLVLEESTPFPANETTFTRKNFPHILEWQRYRDDLRNQGREVRIVKLADIHFPCANLELLDLAYEAIYDFNPDLITIGDDEHDFSSISKFPQHIRNRTRGVVKPAVMYHERHVRNLKSAAPNARLVHLTGNHDYRIAEHIMNHPEAGDGTIDIIEESCRYGGAWFLGWEVDDIVLRSQNYRSMGLCHGHRTNENAAKSMFLDFPHDYVVFGHIHRRTLLEKSYMVEGEWINRWAISTGALCEMVPEYSRNSRSNWQPGFVFLRFHTKTGEGTYEQIMPNDNNEFYWGSKLYRPRPIGR